MGYEQAGEASDRHYPHVRIWLSLVVMFIAALVIYLAGLLTAIFLSASL